MKRRLRLDLAYDGSAYAGWQMQHNAPTVQEMLERALARINGDRRVVVHGAGRTDSGVHARQQVCDFVLDSPMNDDDIAHALAKLLPDDIRPLRVGSVDDSFHAQFSATAKSYRYQLDLSRYGDPLQARYAWHLGKPLDQAAIDAALTWIPGEKDWSGFAGSKCTVVSKVRDVTDATFDRDGDRGFFHFRANGFLPYFPPQILCHK